MSSQIESQQVRIQLTKDPEILAAMRRRGALLKRNGKEVFSVTFDSKEIEFEVGGGPRAFGETVAKALIRSSLTLMGNADPDPKKNDDLICDAQPALVESGRFDVARELPANVCQFCGAAADSVAALAKHVSSECPKVLELATVPEADHENAPAGVR